MFKLFKKKESVQAIPPNKTGDYFKFFYCGDCDYAIHDRTLKNVECCRKCGGEIKRVVGRWEYEFKVVPYFSGYFPVKFHPKTD